MADNMNAILILRGETGTYETHYFKNHPVAFLLLTAHRIDSQRCSHQ